MKTFLAKKSTTAGKLAQTEYASFVSQWKNKQQFWLVLSEINVLVSFWSCSLNTKLDITHVFWSYFFIQTIPNYEFHVPIIFLNFNYFIRNFVLWFFSWNYFGCLSICFLFERPNIFFMGNWGHYTNGHNQTVGPDKLNAFHSFIFKIIIKERYIWSIIVLETICNVMRTIWLI